MFGLKKMPCRLVSPPPQNCASGIMPTRKICAVGGTVLQLTDAKAVEIVTAGFEILVRIPGGDGVVIDTRCVQDGLPQLFHGLAGPQLREELLGPLHAGDGRDAPLIFVLDLVAVALDDRILFCCALAIFS